MNRFKVGDFIRSNMNIWHIEEVGEFMYKVRLVCSIEKAEANGIPPKEKWNGFVLWDECFGDVLFRKKSAKFV